MIKFYYSGAPNPMKVALMLEECELPYEPVPVDTRKGEQHKPEFLALNPNGKVPVVVDGDATVFDSNAILLYLAEKTGKFLPPKGDKARGELLSWLMFVARVVFGPAEQRILSASLDRTLRLWDAESETLRPAGRSGTTAFLTSASASRNTWWVMPTASSTWRYGAGHGSFRWRSGRSTGRSFRT